MPDIVSLWPDGAPGSEDWSHEEQESVFRDPWPHRVIRNVTQPTLTVFLPDSAVATGTAVIVCKRGPPVDAWIERLGDWMEAQALLA